MIIKFSILAGVSSDAQVQDKASIDEQIKFCRQAVAQLGGVEIECYRMDGYSRTGYDSLAEAMDDIPPLKAAIEDAEQNRYDVLMLDNWDRLGDLGQLVSTRFKKYRKQIYSARQSGRLHDPQTYDPYAEESGDIDMHIQGIIQKYRIGKMHRGYEIGMPRRIEKGLTPLRVPFGYIWVSSKEPPRLDPPRAVLLQQMKDLLLKGRSLRAIADYANETGIAPSRGGEKWDIGSLKYMLANPYYAGIVGTKRTKYIFDPHRKRKRRSVPQPRAQWLEGKGLHEPLWDEATHRTIVKEFERRYATSKNYSNRFPLSGLLTCSECRRKLYRRTHGHGLTARKVFSCAVGPADIILPYEEVIDLVAQELIVQLSAQPDASLDASADPDHTQAAIDALEEERKRIQSGFRSGIYKEAEAVEEIRKIEKQIESLQHQEQEREFAVDLRAELRETLQDNLQALPSWIREDDPQIVNRLLSALCEDIILHPDRRVEIVGRA